MGDPKYVLGIDLGTTNSCVAVYRNNKLEVITNQHSKNTTPSVVAFSDNTRIVGDDAKNQLSWNFENTVYGVKRLIGRNFTDPEIQNDIRHWPFNVVSDYGKPKIKVKFQGKDKIYHPEEISSMVLEELKKIAEAHLQCEVTEAVITVPAYFDNNQRQATRAAGKIAGLKVRRLINEPTAAALAYGLDKTEKHTILVYDLGGGTFDVSILRMEKGIFEVKGTKGNSHLGGEDFDTRMVEHFAKRITEEHGKDVFTDKRALRRLKHACEKAKIQLSAPGINTVLLDDLPNLLPDVDFEFRISKLEFENMNNDLFESTITMVEEALKECNMGIKDIQDVVLVGGSTRIPKIQSLLKTFFKKSELKRNINPDEAVAVGAAVQGALLSSDRPVALEGIELYDVVPLSLGTDIIGGKMSVIIPKNTTIPTRKRATYSTTHDDQTEMLVQVYEGERMFIKDNSLLGQTTLSSIPPEPRGYAKVDVIFEIDDDCILHVKARDRDSKKEQNLQILNTSKRIADAEMNRLMREAEANRLADTMQALRIDALNELEFYMQDIKSACNSMSTKLSERQKSLVNQELKNTREWIDEYDITHFEGNDFRDKKTELEEMWNPIITQCVNADGIAKNAGKPVVYCSD